MAQLFERDCEWFEVWHHWGVDPLNLAIVAKFRDDDIILLWSLADNKVWTTSPDYEVIRLELAQDEFSQVRGRVFDDDHEQ